MSTKRIIPCLDVRNSRVVKGKRFEGLQDLASPVKLAKRYCEEGADELAFYDITASLEGRKLFTDILQETAQQVTVPFCVGGGVTTLDDVARLIDCGADKVSINSGAIRRPELIFEAAKRYGSGRVVLSVDVKQVGDTYRVFLKSGQEETGLDAIQWVRRCVDLGAGEVLINAIDADGMQQGFDLSLLERVLEAVQVPVIASGGAGSAEDFVRLFTELPDISAGLAASVFHFGQVHIPELKQRLHDAGIAVRMNA